MVKKRNKYQEFGWIILGITLSICGIFLAYQNIAYTTIHDSTWWRPLVFLLWGQAIPVALAVVSIGFTLFRIGIYFELIE